MSKIFFLFSLLFVPVFFILALLGIVLMGSSNDTKYYKASDKHASSVTTIIEKKQWQNVFTEDLLANNKIESSFTAQADNLGVIAVPFNTHNRSINDRIAFRLKEKGKKDWYVQNEYNSNQIQTNIPFPFGFPIIKDSKGKIFILEIESLSGKPGSSISLSKLNFYFISEYKFSTNDLIRNPGTLFQFLYYKIINYLPLLSFGEVVIIFFVTLSPLFFYLFYATVRHINKRDNRYLRFLGKLLFEQETISAKKVAKDIYTG